MALQALILLGCATPAFAQDNASIVADDIPAVLAAGARAHVHLTLKNTGTTTWSMPGTFGLGAVGDAKGQATLFLANAANPHGTAYRVEAPASTALAPGQTYTFAFDIVAPQTAGTYTPAFQMVHEAVHWFGAQDAKTIAVTNPDPWVRVKNAHFELGGQPWFPIGPNYYPISSMNPKSRFTGYWFQPGVYDPNEIEADLKVMDGWSMNALWIQGPSDPAYFANLHDFLDRCRNHGKKVMVFLSGADPFMEWEHAPDGAIATIQGAGLAQRPEVYAYDIAWEPKLGTELQRAPLEIVWSRWVASHYSSLAQAEAAFGGQLRVAASGQRAGFVSESLPARAVAGASYSCRIQAKNISTDTTWSPGASYRLGLMVATGTGAPGRVNLAGNVGPGGTGDFDFTYTAPTTPGRYFYRFGMLQEGVAWFGQMLDLEVEVVAQGAPAQGTVPLPAPVLGPTDSQLASSGPWDALVQAYRHAIDAEVSRRYAKVVRAIKAVAPDQLVSCRQGYGGNGSVADVPKYPLALPSTGAHFDFLSVEGYVLRTLDSSFVRSHAAALDAYARWAAGETKPMIWAESGYYNPANVNPQELAAAGQWYDIFLSALTEAQSDGTGAWWWPGGPRLDEGTDFGLLNHDRSERPCATAFRKWDPLFQGPRPAKTDQVIAFDPIQGTMGDTSVLQALDAQTLAVLNAGKHVVIAAPGEATTQLDPVTFIAPNATKDLWADVHQVEIATSAAGPWTEVSDGGAYAIPKGSPVWVRARIFNIGTTKWLASGTNAAHLGGNEAFGLGFRAPIPQDTPRLGEAVIAPFEVTTALNADATVQLQLVAEYRAWIDGSIQVRLVTGP